VPRLYARLRPGTTARVGRCRRDTPSRPARQPQEATAVPARSGATDPRGFQARHGPRARRCRRGLARVPGGGGRSDALALRYLLPLARPRRQGVTPVLQVAQEVLEVALE